ncbi:MAG: IPTL-CTERM sorting domain-containing protein [Acidobacteria bacterium]|nr:IPTL-CTERM sorting domain-containing protein [Acidobacteriota bacterium]MCB9396620.1 IPTL-CTERM sorting domain-containing protein [Acidobacteriota bacterium]
MLIFFYLLLFQDDHFLVSAGSLDINKPNSRSVAGGSVLFDTSGGIDSPAFAVVSTRFSDASLGGFHTAGADDFTIADCGWKIERIRVYGSYSDPQMSGYSGPADSVNVYILAKSGSLPTSTNLAGIAIYAAEQLSYTELDLVNGGDFEIVLPNGLVLPEGDYWLVVQANMSLFAVGQWNWTESALTPNSGTTNGDESAWFQSAAVVLSPVTGTSTCVGSWGARVTSCQMTRNPDPSPPADRDFAFVIEGNVLAPSVSVSPTTLYTVENGSTNGYWLVLNSPPSAGETVTVSPISNDTTEGTISGAVMFTTANWDVPQFVTITPGASGDGNDGDVMYFIDNNVASDDPMGCYPGVMAMSVGVTNANIDGIATIIVDPNSGITVSEDGSVTQVVTIEAGSDVTPAADVTVGLTNNSPTQVSLSVPSVTLTAGNGYSSTVTITGVSDNLVEGTQPFSITTDASSSVDAAYNGVNPYDISGTVTDSNFAAVDVTPSGFPIITSETGTTATISYVLAAQPVMDVSFTLSSNDPSEASVLPTTLTFTNGNWNLPQMVTVTGLDDAIQDGNIAYRIISTPISSMDPYWDGISVSSVDGVNNDQGDVAGVTVNPTSGLITTEGGGTDTFTVVLDSQPIANVSVDFTSQDTTEGLVGPMGGPYATTHTVTFTNANWNTPQTVEVQGQDDAVADGNVLFTVASGNVTSSDPIYDAITDAAVADVTVTNQDDIKTIGISVSPNTLMMNEGDPAQGFNVSLESEPTADVMIPVVSSDTTEATVSPSMLTFTAANWNVPQTVMVTPVADGIIDGDEMVSINLGPATGGDYAGQTASVSVTVFNVDFCAPMTLNLAIGQGIQAFGSPDCTFDLYKTNGSTDPMDWVLLGTFTLDANGQIQTGVVAEPDCYYVTTVSGTFTILTTAIYHTVPTLGQWGILAFAALLLAAGIWQRRRRLIHL